MFCGRCRDSSPLRLLNLFDFSDDRHHSGRKSVALACWFYFCFPGSLHFQHSQKGSFGPPWLVSYMRRPFFARRHLSKVHSRPYIYEKSLVVGMVHICFSFFPHPSRCGVFTGMGFMRSEKFRWGCFAFCGKMGVLLLLSFSFWLSFPTF